MPLNYLILNLCVSNLLGVAASASLVIPVNALGQQIFGNLGCMIYVFTCGMLGGCDTK